jgi:hypothetical protein
LKYSGAMEDAAYLAQLLRPGLLPEGYIYPCEEPTGRDLRRKRMQLVRCRTARILALKATLAISDALQERRIPKGALTAPRLAE